MDTFKLKTSILRATGKKCLLGLMLASTLSLLPTAAVQADRDDMGGRDGFHGDRDGWRGDRDGWRDHEEWRRREAYGNGYGGYGGGYNGYQQPMQQPYGYAQPVYVPPPVQYMPPQSPGINLVVPLNFR